MCKHVHVNVVPLFGIIFPNQRKINPQGERMLRNVKSSRGNRLLNLGATALAGHTSFQRTWDGILARWMTVAHLVLISVSKSGNRSETTSVTWSVKRRVDGVVKFRYITYVLAGGAVIILD